MKEESDINTYLTKAMDIKNQLKAFDKIITNEMFINIIINRLH